MKTLFLLCMLCAASFAYAQVNISGRVISSANNLPVSGASVYINNTTIGTVTDDNGDFSIQTDYFGKLDLVVSHIAFERKVMHLSAGLSPLQLKISLDRKTNVLTEVDITGGSLKAWKKWHELFINYFIGTSEFADKCTIKNPEVLIFHYDKANNKLHVTSRNTLIVENMALGYIYKIDLKYFDYSFKTLLAGSDITAFFKDIKPAGQKQQATFLANRKVAFEGSRMHFFRSVYRGSNSSDGFAMVGVHLTPNTEKKRVIRIFSDALAKAYEQNMGTYIVSIPFIANNDMDTIAYYKNKLAEPDYNLRDTSSVSLKDSLVKEPQNTYERLRLRDTLLIQYDEHHAVPAKMMPIAKNTGISFTSDHVFYLKKTPGGMKYSLLTTTSQKDLIIYPNGSYEEDNVFTDGYMARWRVAGLLPWDYRSGN